MSKYGRVEAQSGIIEMVGICPKCGYETYFESQGTLMSDNSLMGDDSCVCESCGFEFTDGEEYFEEDEE